MPNKIITVGIHNIKKYTPPGTSPIKYPVFTLCIIIVYRTLNRIAEIIYIVLLIYDIVFLQIRGMFANNKYKGCKNKYAIANIPKFTFMRIKEIIIHNILGR